MDLLFVKKQISTEAFEATKMDSVDENSCQLCAMDKFAFAPIPVYCSSCGILIKRKLIYYWADSGGAQYCFCTSCFKRSNGDSISFHGISISKAKLLKERNDKEYEESWVQCDKCKCWQHQICALYNDKRDLEGKAEYICPQCCLEEIEIGKRIPLPKTTVFGAKDLPTTMLSDHIEQRLVRRLEQERKERESVLGKNPDEVPVAEDLVVRVVLSANKHLKVKREFLDIFRGENYPSEFMYRSKVILLFQKIEGVDVCIFGMYVQEFGSECGYPNQRCVYISYLDSVKYFRPEIVTVTSEALRTFVYHEILIGYLDYCKKQGFAMCYIWACPPLRGEDYILYCHPENQRTPKSDKLRQWYEAMLRKATQENVVVDYTNIHDHLFAPARECNTKITAARLPYFDGAYWCGAAEDIIRKIEKECGVGLQKKVRRLITKRSLKAIGQSNSSDDVAKDVLVMEKLGQTILPKKEDFIVVHLHFTCSLCHEVILSGGRWICHQCRGFQLCTRCLNKRPNSDGRRTHTSTGGEKHALSQVVVDDVPHDTNDKDGNIDNALFENRHTFLGFCQSNHYQFDTLRHAKYSSMMILYHLNKPAAFTLDNRCRVCHKDVAADQSWHCETCPEFDVCDACYQRKGSICHVHNLTHGTFEVSCETKTRKAQLRQDRSLQERRLLDVLMHASECHATKSNPCTIPKCLEIRRLFKHSGQCKLRAAGGCILCKKTWFLLQLHSQSCGNSSCCIPRCRDIKKHSEMHALQSNTPHRAAVFGLENT